MLKKDDELDLLEENIRKLKNKYDQFFSGIQKMPPLTERRAIETYIYELGKLNMRDNARRFRYNTLLSRYNQHREMWARRIREREEGPLEFKRRQAVMNQEPEQRSAPPAPERPVTSEPGDPYVRVSPGTNGEAMRALYDRIREEHERIGKSPNLTLQQLTDMIQKQSESLRSRYNVNTVAFRVETIDGKVKLKAKPIQE
jgi:hypothetical protein